MKKMALPFSVRRTKPYLIVPAEPTPSEIKQLSDIDDQQGLRFHYAMVMLYRSNLSMKEKDPVKVVREAVAKALVYYYPYAGRLVEGPNNKLMVDCNGEGVLFIEADADVKLEQLGIQPPSPYLEELLYDVPGSRAMVGCPLMLIQITRLICGGFVFAIRLNHVLSDALGLVQFLNAVEEMAKGGASAPSIPPVWRRDRLNARFPPHISRRHHEYEEVDSDTLLSTDQKNLVHQSFFFGPKEMRAIRKHLPPHNRSCSTFDAVTACLWRSRTIVLQLDPDEVVAISFMVNVRGINSLRLPAGYYGNAVVTPGAVSKAGKLCKNSLGYAIGLVKKAKEQVSEEYVRSVADLMVIKGRPPYATKLNYIVSDTSRAGFGEVNFGWGKPICAGTIGCATTYSSVYSKYQNSEGEDVIVVPVCLPVEAMERLKEELRKMTEEPLVDSYIRSLL